MRTMFIAGAIPRYRLIGKQQMLRSWKRSLAVPVALLAAVLAGTGCDYNEEQEAGTQDDRHTAVVYPGGTTELFAETPPGTDAEEPTDTVTIVDGEVSDEEIIFPTGEGLVLALDNQDDRQYELRIENVATVDLVAANSLTVAELAMTEPGTYPAVLTEPGSPEEIASFVIVIVER